MKIFEIPEVFGEDCDQECALAFTDCLMMDARKQKMQQAFEKNGGRRLEGFAPGEWQGAQESVCYEKFDTLLWNAAKIHLEKRK